MDTNPPLPLASLFTPNDIDFTSPRVVALNRWLQSEVREDYAISIASADASFRRYFRITTATTTHIVMDAPPANENCRPFVKVAVMMADAGLHVPRLLAQDLDQGFLLLTDLGTQTLLDVLDESNVDYLLRSASDELIKWQLASRSDTLPAYDEALLHREVNLFPDWYIARHLNVSLTSSQRATLEASMATILASNLAQQRVYVHRDFMPRNLMVPQTPAGPPGVLDFQDAVYGPIGYDIASLYKDAFISWDEERVLDGTIRYWEKAKKARLPVPADFADFFRDVEWMGLQRHLKILGIFARLNYRDGKPRYLADTPRFVTYVRKVGERYQELWPLVRLFDALKIDNGMERKVSVTF